MKEENITNLEPIGHAVFIELVKSNVISQVEARALRDKWYIHTHVNGQPRVLTAKRGNIRKFANPATLLNYTKDAGIRRVIFEN